MKIEKVSYKQGVELIDSIPNQTESTVYQRKEFLDLYHKSQYFRIIGIKPEVNALHKRFFFITGKENGKLVMLMACEVNCSTGTLGLMGDQKQINNIYYDAESFSYQQFGELMDYLVAIEEIKNIFFQNLCKDTLLYKYVETWIAEHPHYASKNYETVCVAVNIEDGNFDTWHSNLSKSVRQNLRTAYNHFKSDGTQYKVKHYLGGVGLKEALREMYLQRRRNLEKRGASQNRKNILLCKIGAWLSLINPRTQMLMKSEKSYVCELWIEGELAAFVGGYLSAKGRFFIPFLKYNMDYKRYSPGGVVINESIKWLCESDYALRCYDLLTGDEPYKFSYGGQEYRNANIKIEVRK